MKSTAAVTLSILAATLILATACSDLRNTSEQAKFASLPSDCWALEKSTTTPVKQFGGSLYDENLRFKIVDRSPLPPVLQSSSFPCSVHYTAKTLPERRETGDRPQFRFISIWLTIDTSSEDPIESTKEFFGKQRDKRRGEKIYINAGDEAFTSEQQKVGREVQAETSFRISNLIVEVTASATNFSGTDDIAIDSPSAQQVSEAKLAAESIARAIADNIATIMPRK
ncbi:hypothetical protein [Nocardia sp. NPDC052566]|uniref:hypothetical protein n=1 Tax=Nocardia sp. NPDC052566 TaxID=3364330 RepID=UPI0037C94554